MKKSWAATVLVVVTIAFPFTGRAQFFKKLADNVKQTAQNKANAKASDATNKALDSAIHVGGNSGQSGPGGGDTASSNRVLRAMAKTAQDNPNDTSGADIAKKMFNNLAGGGGVSAEDSAKAIQIYRSANGGSGIFYQLVTVMTGKMNRRDTSSSWITSGGEGRKEMTMFGSGQIVTIGRISQPTYSIILDEGEKSFSLVVIDTSLINNAEKYKIEKLGMETAAGYPSAHVRVTSTIGSGMFKSSSVSEMWLSTEIPGYSMLKNGLLEKAQEIGMMKALRQAGVEGFLVKMSSGGKDYSITVQLQQIKEGHFPSSYFMIPAGYKESDEGIAGKLMPSAR